MYVRAGVHGRMVSWPYGHRMSACTAHRTPHTVMSESRPTITQQGGLRPRARPRQHRLGALVGVHQGLPGQADRQHLGQGRALCLQAGGKAGR